MGGDARTLILPVPIGPRGVSSWAQHQRRDPRSDEPGTDIYCDNGTEVVAPADGVIYGYGESVIPATGRWVGINFDDGRSFRCMHHSRITRKGGRVRQGDVIALSGSSGYGSEFFGEPSRNAAFWYNTGGDHTHVTLWPTHDHIYGYGRDGDYRKPYTIDIMDFIRPNEPEDDMYNDSDRARDDKMAEEVHGIWQSIFQGGTDMPDGMRSIGDSLDNLTQFASRIDGNVKPVRDAVFDGGESMPDGKRSIGQSLADIAAALGIKRNA